MSSSVIALHPVGHLIVFPHPFTNGKSANMVFQQGKSPAQQDSRKTESEVSIIQTSGAVSKQKHAVGDVDFKGKPFMTSSSSVHPQYPKVEPATIPVRESESRQNSSHLEYKPDPGQSIPLGAKDDKPRLNGDGQGGKGYPPTILSTTSMKATVALVGQANATIKPAPPMKPNTHRPLSTEEISANEAYESKVGLLSEQMIKGSDSVKHRFGIQLNASGSEYEGKFIYDKSLHCRFRS